MSLFPIKNDSIDGTLNTPTDSVYKNGFRMNGDQVCMSTGAHASYSQGVSLDSNGAVRVVDVTSGIPAGAQWQNGLLLNSTGALCYSSGAVGSWLNGLPMSSNGAHIANTLIPTPTRSFSFTTGVLDSAITFTRASGGTYTDSTGTLQLATTNTPRFDYDPVTLAAKGLLIEEQRTNLLTYSDQFDNAAWTKTRSSITANATAAPDGTMAADKLVEDTQTGAHRVSEVVTSAANATLTLSVYVKAAGRNFVVLRLDASASDGAYVAFNLSTGAVGTTAGTGTGYVISSSISSIGNGWYRCSISGVASSTVANPQGAIHLAVSSTDPTNTSIVYTGDGTSGLYIWGAQLEAGSFATSYIPTTTAQATRAADVAVVTGTNFSSWYNSSQGTVFVEGDASTASAQFPTFAMASASTVASSLGFLFLTASLGGFEVKDGGVSQVALYPSVATTTRKVAYAYNANDFAVSYNGVAPTLDTTGTIPTVDRFTLGASITFANISYLNGHIKSLAFYNTRLSDAQLQTLTA